MLHAVCMLASGSAISQLIQLLNNVLLARIYDTSQFGIFAQVTALGSIIAIVGGLQMHQAMVLPINEGESSGLFATGFFTSTLIAIISFITLSIFKENVFGNALHSSLPLFSSFLALVLCYGNLLRGWQTARGNFRVLSVFTVIHSICIVFFQLGLGLLKIDNGLVYGVLIGELITSLFFLLFKYSPKMSSIFPLLIKPKTIFNYIRSYHQFSLAGTIQELISVLVLMLPLFMFSRVYGADVGGQYAVASRFAWAPILLVGSALTQVVFYNFSGLSIGELEKSSMMRFGKITLVILCVGCIGALIFPLLLPLILGNNWSMAGTLGGLVLIWATGFFLSIPYRVCFRVLKWQYAQLIVDAIVLLFMFILFIQFSKFSPMILMLGVAFIGVCQNLLLIYIMRHYLRFLLRIQSI